MRYIGIDPGVTGAIACLTPDIASVVDIPVLAKRIDTRGLVAQLSLMTERPNTHVLCHVFLEKAQSMPGKFNTQAIFHYGVNYGFLLSALAILELPYTEVHPATWKRKLGLSADKEECRARAQQLFPQCDLRHKKDHGRAEALLIAWYGMQSYKM